MAKKKKNKLLSWIWYFVVVLIVFGIGFNLPSLNWLEFNLKLALQIIITTSIASFIGNLIEERNWSQLMKRFTSPITRWANLPNISATAIFSSFFSLITANSMLTSAYESNQMSRKQLRVSAMCTSFMSYLYHSLRIMYPTIAAVGVVGASYFGLLFGLGFLVVFIALLASRYSKTIPDIQNDITVEKEERSADTWRVSIEKARKKTYLVVNRMFLIAIPMFLFFSFLNEIGFFDLSDSLFKSSSLREYFPPESLAVASSMLGGILSAATVAAGFLKTGSLQAPHVLIALLMGNIISLPIRSLRRSLPSAMSVFPAKEALVIVLLNQGSRLVSNILLLGAILLLMYYHIL
ncbi:hypothetical protein [Marinifilum fragile]|uniref:hypothetical protein n=1 Tax=Marinifilum fragile TaxID=570161 RepID=UPI002AA8724B|nr:hypothetical protein [Marinifilum fragile]